MDGASAIAGLIGLAALTGQSAVRIKRFVKEYNESPKRREDIQRWMLQVQGILADVKRLSIEIKGHGLLDLEVSIRNLEECLQQCNAKLAELQADLAKQSHVKRLGKVKTALSIPDIDRKRDDVDRLLENASHCCDNLFRQLDLHGFPLLQRTSKQVESMADEIATLSLATQTLSADNAILREQVQTHADTLSGDLGEVQRRLDKVNQLSETTLARFDGMENSVASIYGMAAILPQEIQSIIAQTVSQSVATSIASLQHDRYQSPPRGRILHRKVVPTKTKTLKSTTQGFEDLESGKGQQIHLNLRTYPYTLNQSQKIVLWRGTMLFYEVTVVLRRTRRTKVFKSHEMDKNFFEIDVYTQSKGWPIAGRIHANLQFGQGGGFSAIPLVNITPSRFVCEDNPLVQAIKAGNIDRVRIGFANNELYPLDIIVDVSRRQGIKSDLGLVEYAAHYQQLDIINLLLEQGAQPDVTKSALTISLVTNVFEGTNRNKDVLQSNIDINRALLNAGSKVEAVLVTDFYLFTIAWRFTSLASLAPICEDYWENMFKLLWGPYKASDDLNSLTDDEGRDISAIDELLYDLYLLQRNSMQEDPWAFQRLELALKFGARIDAPSHHGNLSIQNFIARVSTRFRYPGYGRWMGDFRTENECMIIFHSLLWLMSSGADPVAIDEHGQTATWLAFYCQLLPEWFAALGANGINTEYVARHAISAVRQDFLDGLGTVLRAPYTYQACSLENTVEIQLHNLWGEFGIRTVDEARGLMAQEFAEYGCNVVIFQDSPHEYGLLTTGVDYDLPHIPKSCDEATARRRVRPSSSRSN